MKYLSLILLTTLTGSSVGRRAWLKLIYSSVGKGFPAYFWHHLKLQHDVEAH